MSEGFNEIILLAYPRCESASSSGNLVVFSVTLGG